MKRVIVITGASAGIGAACSARTPFLSWSRMFSWFSRSLASRTSF